MTETPPAAKRNRLLQYGALGAAAAAAIAIGAYVFLSGGGERPAASPAEAARAFYDALEGGDGAALALLAPETQEETTPLGLAFPTSQFAPDGGSGVAVSALEVQAVNEQDGWASVRARGRFQAEGASVSHEFDELLYLRNVDGRWLVSSPSAFKAALGGPATPSAAGRAAGLGPLGPQRPKLGELAPDFALIDARDGVTVRKLSEFRGKAVVLNWYASWCGPCKAEIPEFQAAAVALEGEVVFLGVDYLETRDKAQSILDIFGAKYPAVLDSDGTVADHYRVGQGLPSTFFIDKDGIFRAQQIGQVRREDLINLLAKVGVTYRPE